MITYDEAMQVVWDELEPDWDGPGTFYVSEEGQTDGRYYAVPAGAEEALVGNDRNYMPLDDTVHLVEIKTGRYRMEPLMETQTRQWRDIRGAAPIKTPRK